MSKREVAKSITRISGTILMFVITINFYLILGMAMINDHKVGVYFNMFGEAKIEYAIYSIILPIILYSCYSHIQEFRKKKKEYQRRIANA